MNGLTKETSHFLWEVFWGYKKKLFKTVKSVLIALRNWNTNIIPYTLNVSPTSPLLQSNTCDCISKKENKLSRFM